jgi:hypothetical protein
MQGGQKLRSEAHFRVRRSDEVEAQPRPERDGLTFYETIIFGMFMVLGMVNGAKPLSV